MSLVLVGTSVNDRPFDYRSERVPDTAAVVVGVYTVEVAVAGQQCWCRARQPPRT
jgi:hypothetical protein